MQDASGHTYQYDAEGRTGLWPFWIHDEIYYEALKNVLGVADIQAIDRASFAMDFGKGQQDPLNSYEHSMRDGQDGESLFQAADAARQFVSSQEEQAKLAQAEWLASGHSGYSPTALLHFGNALHTLTDATSPSHRGFQPWKDGYVSGLLHVLKESTGLGGGVDDAESATRQAFSDTFGDFQSMMASTTKVGWSCVAATGAGAPRCEWYFEQ